METFLFAMLGTVAGALITFLCSRYYYKKTAREVSIIARGLEEGLSLEFARDKSGNVTGLRLTRTATTRARIAVKQTRTATARAAIAAKPPNDLKRAGQ